MRDDVIKKGLKEARKVFDEMNESRNMDYTEHTVKINKNLMIKFECVRYDVGSKGAPVYFDICAIKDGKEVDCCTLHYSPDIDAVLLYLLNCYV